MLALYMVSHMLSRIASGLLTAQGSSAARCHHLCLSLSCPDQTFLMSQYSYDFNLLNKRQTQRLFRKRHARWGRRGNRIETKALRPPISISIYCCSYNLACLIEALINPQDLSNVSILERASKKHLQREGRTWNLIGQTVTYKGICHICATVQHLAVCYRPVARQHSAVFNVVLKAVWSKVKQLCP